LELIELAAEIFPIAVFFVAILNFYARIDVFSRAGLHHTEPQFVRINPEVIQVRLPGLFKGFDNCVIFGYAVFVDEIRQTAPEGVKTAIG
jgi:hypothetical protein